MIKYETSLEESKQIKELGFDFSNICEKFVNNDNCCAYTKYINNTVYYVFTQFQEDQGVHVRMTDWCEILDNSYVPVIPYPILEACLPSLTSKDSRFAVGRRWEKAAGKNLYFNKAVDQGVSCSLLSAFTWCCQFRLEETKQQFNEVMGMYK
ncbi:hypothetical protein [Prochlorococcus sp. ALOHA_ZT_50]|jgi:hypothetical protein|uniref:hypothetical protein n=1 Tax=Prochlorococcus sp. ALOHA_ZT_50 TaxID=2919303 RepID=UPI00257ED9F3|nr:hypothetical protein [Prochlorococcus sp. ALOHA_ZT_50]MCH2079624.1 hypothetical protein [Prochlorococcus sp. ALOHA_ZT_50]